MVLAVLLSNAANAYADDAAEERAHALFVAGRAAVRAADDRLACDDFALSLELHSAPGTLVNLALCEERVGRLARSHEHFADFLRAAAPDDDRRELAESHLAAIAPRLSHLSIRLAPGIRSESLTLDGAPLTLDAGAPLVLDPGQHHLALHVEGQPVQSTDMRLGEGSETTLEVPWVAPEPVRPASKPAPAPPDAPRSSLAGFIIAGVGLAALVVSAGMGVAIIHEKQVVQAHCPQSRCDAEGWAAAKTGRALVTAGSVSLGLGIVAGGTGTYLLLAPDSSSRAPAAMIHVGGAF